MWLLIGELQFMDVKFGNISKLIRIDGLEEGCQIYGTGARNKLMNTPIGPHWTALGNAKRVCFSLTFNIILYHRFIFTAKYLLCGHT